MTNVDVGSLRAIHEWILHKIYVYESPPINICSVLAIGRGAITNKYEHPPQEHGQFTSGEPRGTLYRVAGNCVGRERKTASLPVWPAAPGAASWRCCHPDFLFFGAAETAGARVGSAAFTAPSNLRFVRHTHVASARVMVAWQIYYCLCSGQTRLVWKLWKWRKFHCSSWCSGGRGGGGV